MNHPISIKEPRMIFVNSMSDLFHKDIPFRFIENVFEIIKRTHWHQYQILTKRSKRLEEFGDYYGMFPDNSWIGVSVESASYKNRIDDLRHIKTNSFPKFRAASWANWKT
jgi:protein gp37